MLGNGRNRKWAAGVVAVATVLMVAAAALPRLHAEDDPVRTETWDYVASSKEIAKKFTGKEGVVVHMGDSITYANPYSAWARYGKGKTEDDKRILAWSHCGKEDDTDGWFLAHHDEPTGRSDTAASGVRSDEYIKGGKGGLPPLDELIKKYNPQMVVLMLGTNDIDGGRKVADIIKDMTTIIDKLHANGTIVILSSIPPNFGHIQETQDYNAALYKLAEEKKMPFLDFYGHILKLEPGMAWNGTILTKNGVHPTANDSAGEPTDENFKKSGYLLRGWLSVEKILEVHDKIWGK
ncbi:MAG: SGNH/GDSL hydrolase family protein [Planctomycetota bacterium]